VLLEQGAHSGFIGGKGQVAHVNLVKRPLKTCRLRFEARSAGETVNDRRAFTDAGCLLDRDRFVADLGEGVAGSKETKEMVTSRRPIYTIYAAIDPRTSGIGVISEC
jgi:hypothetical protein